MNYDSTALLERRAYARFLNHLFAAMRISAKDSAARDFVNVCNCFAAGHAMARWAREANA
jgi:hypothetical protein